MQVRIRDADAVRAVTPAALSAYARAAGWRAQEQYRVHSDVYVGEGRPELIIPRTARLGDYASVVAALIQTFAHVEERDELTVYRDLMTADRDVVRLRAAEIDDGSVTLNAGAALIDGARELLLSVACSLGDPRPFYRAGANKKAKDLLERVRLGQTDQGSFVVTLLTPVVPPPLPALFPGTDDLNPPIERRLTRRLVDALVAVRVSVERTTVGDEGAFDESVDRGVSANLCDALVRLIEPFPTLDVGVSWARTRPVNELRTVVPFAGADAAVLREAARSLRDRAPRPDVGLTGFVRHLTREQSEIDGTIRVAADVDGRQQSVMALLDREDYELAVKAHRDRSVVVLRGDLDRIGQRWRLLNPRIESVISDSEPD